jgi:8-amino-7-oxononanoate synthase
VADYTSALYLGLRHTHAALSPWDALTLGMPAALCELEGAGEVALQIARLVGTEAAALWPSTLHLLWDLFAVLAEEQCAVVLDGGAYPIARWAAAGAALRGVPICDFRHFDPALLASALSSSGAARGGRPVVVTDGFCAGCGRTAPLTEYTRVVEDAGGVLVVEDTQVVGILGRRPCPAAPYGEGGGGSLQRHHVRSENVVWVASLAKGLGAPLAALAASSPLVERIRRRAPTRVHASPPSAAVIAAAARGLAMNRTEGRARRARLATQVRALRQVLSGMGLAPRGGALPVQRIALASRIETERLHGALRRRGVKAVLARAACTGRTEIAFLVTALHTASDVREVETALREISKRWNDVDDGGWSCAESAGFPASEVG